MTEKELIKMMNEVNNDLEILMKDRRRLMDRIKKAGNKANTLSVELANYCEKNHSSFMKNQVNQEFEDCFKKVQETMKKHGFME